MADILDRDLATAYANLEKLCRKDGRKWNPPKRFVEAVGEELLFDTGTNAYEAMILAHPVLFLRQYATLYRAKFEERNVVETLLRLGRY